VFIQTLIPLAYRGLLSKGIWDALKEISHVFREIYALTSCLSNIWEAWNKYRPNNLDNWDDISYVFLRLNGAYTYTSIV